MTRRHVSILIIGMALVAGACSSSPRGSDDSGPVSVPDSTIGRVTPTTSAGQGGIGGAIKILAEAPGQANDSACVTEVQILTTASEAFSALKGSKPTSQNDLFEAGLISEPSPWFEITPDGVIVPAPQSPCS